jgi:hypothetical protein
MRKIMTAVALLVAAPFLFAQEGLDQEYYWNVTGDAWFVNVGGDQSVYARSSQSGQLLVADMDEVAISPVIDALYLRKGIHGAYASILLVDEDDGMSGSCDCIPTNVTFKMQGQGASYHQSLVNTELVSVDVQYARGLNWRNEESFMVLRAGVSYSDIDFETTYGFDPALDNSVFEDLEFSGFGPSIGFDINQRIFGVERLRAFAGTTIAYLAGTSEAKRHEFSKGATVFMADREDDKSIIHFKGLVGVSYAFDIGLELRGGFRYARWNDLLAPAVPIGGQQGNEQSVFTEDTRDLSADGFFLGLGWAWRQ